MRYICKVLNIEVLNKCRLPGLCRIFFAEAFCMTEQLCSFLETLPMAGYVMLGNFPTVSITFVICK